MYLLEKGAEVFKKAKIPIKKKEKKERQKDQTANGTRRLLSPLCSCCNM